MDVLPDPLAIYIHWPFCRSKCPYCDFNSYPRHDVDAARWARALIAEMDHFAAETEGRRAASVFFGGGTPSLMPPEEVARLIAAIDARWPLVEDAEITLEANPTSAEAARFGALRAAGVSRLSLGVQSLDDTALRFLGRAHDVAQARRAWETATALFPRASFDLIYARPGQTIAQWRDELGEALAMARGHLALYQLTIEPGTGFFDRGVPSVDEDTAADLFELTQEMATAAGLPAYEISNHARPGEECRHNLAYWRGDDYLGIGPGAHGRLTDAHGTGTDALNQIADPAAWLLAVETNGHGTAGRMRLTADERWAELIVVGLRLTGGIDRAIFEKRGGISPEAVVDGENLAALVAAGYMESDARGMRATPAGRLRLNTLLVRLLA